ncbi:hypothetical protein E2562_014920 [Oryza meyeriana var. granulata]|uniref:Uncharacterized protein n=1 Tax=Oryza meyeriana var. granulata TaxID=110450 RepID=A0A6G1EK78_9ORYZ|nr:hypothetical protein E2562_014920 [Oryza meyeriana var. granulata]
MAAIIYINKGAALTRVQRFLVSVVSQDEMVGTSSAQPEQLSAWASGQEMDLERKKQLVVFR